MNNIDLATGKLREWNAELDSYRVPEWDEIPDIGLYMEQMILLLEEYLSFLPSSALGEQQITAAAVNNYVRTGIMPRPVKKRYYRVHIAYLLMICLFKHTLKMSMIAEMLPVDAPEEEIRKKYLTFSKTISKGVCHFRMQVSQISSPMLAGAPDLLNYAEDTGDCEAFKAERPGELIFATVILSGLYRLLAQNLLVLEYPEGVSPLLEGIA